MKNKQGLWAVDSIFSLSLHGNCLVLIDDSHLSAYYHPHHSCWVNRQWHPNHVCGPKDDSSGWHLTCTIKVECWNLFYFCLRLSAPSAHCMYFIVFNVSNFREEHPIASLSHIHKYTQTHTHTYTHTHTQICIYIYVCVFCVCVSVCVCDVGVCELH